MNDFGVIGCLLCGYEELTRPSSKTVIMDSLPVEMRRSPGGRGGRGIAKRKKRVTH